MSILIKGMEMPQGNSTINVLIYADGTIYTGHVNDSRYSAVSVPAPHGRLIDADALIKELKECMYVANNNWKYEMVTGYSNAIESVEEACTIIEAEGSDT